jgi:prevent-host-death family protein
MTAAHSRTYNVHDAKTHLSQLLEQVERGDEVVIARAGVPVARLVPVGSQNVARVLGTEAGKIIMADDFDAPLPAQIIAGLGA